MQQTGSKYGALFDLDGVIIDTESQYTILWDNIGQKYLHKPDFGTTIKGSTLSMIFDTYFQSCPEKQKEITAETARFEEQLKMPFIPGAAEFIRSIKCAGWKTAVVTSSSRKKMVTVYKKRPEISEWIDIFLTAEDFPRSKPAPDPYLIAAEKLDIPLPRCIVFEDSLNGLKSGKSSGIKLVGLSTTLSREIVAQYADIVIPDFTQFTPEQAELLIQQNNDSIHGEIRSV